MHDNYCCQYAPSDPHRQQPKWHAVSVQPQTRIHGLVVGCNKYGSGHYLFYTSVIEGFVKISNTVPNLKIGRWLEITIWCANYSGQFVLDCSNSTGYDNFDVLPNPKYTAARFFQKYNYNNEGEVLITTRFGVRANYETQCFEYISYDVLFDHIKDDFQLVKKSGGFYDGRSFIVEAQASLEGWIALKVHEDPYKIYSCDSLPYPVVDFNVQFLEDTPLLKIMTGDGYVHPPEHYINMHQVPSTTTGQTNPQGVQLLPSSLCTEPVKTSDASEPSIEVVQVESAMSRATLTENAQSSSQIQHQRPNFQNQTTSYMYEEVDIDDDDTAETLGTSNIPEKSFIKNVATKTIQRCLQERPSTTENVQSALCVVVQKFENCAIMLSVKQYVLNVLLLEKSCQGLTNSPQLGEIAFFEILPRRIETKDELLPRAPYTHIAVKMKPFTPELQNKIETFRKSVRCFGGLLEMKVTIPLTKPGHLEIYNDDIDTAGSVKSYYLLLATNGVRVTIPTERLIYLLKSDFTADFDLHAWAVHRKPIGNALFHIGKGGCAYQKYIDGNIRELPPIDACHYSMHVKK